MTVFKAIRRPVMIIIFVIFLLSISIAYAATSGELGFSGTAYVQEYDANNSFQFFPVPDANGHYFTSVNLPAGVTIGDQEWIGQIFHLVIYKTANLNGNIQFTMNFNFFNMTNVNWPQGTTTVDLKYSNGAANNAMFPANYTPTLVANAVNANSQGSITMTFSGKITQGIIDAIMFHATYTFTDPITGQIDTGKIYFEIEFRAMTDPPYTGWLPI